MLNIYSTLDNDANRIYKFLARNSESFNPSLSSRLNLENYSDKLAAFAVNIFIFNGKNDLGHASIYLNKPPHAFISSFCIDLEFRGMQFGTYLMVEVIKKCKEYKIKSIELEVFCSNLSALKFYMSHDFFIRKSIGEISIMKKEI